MQLPFVALRIAVKRGGTLYHLHGDHLGSTSLTTAGSVVEASRAYYAYGSERAASGDLQTDRTFTGQKRDSTGLMYYNARYYDPALGTFISPDSMVPGAGQVINYNRFLYARGNPLKYSDPTGNNPLGPSWVQEFTEVHGRPPNDGDQFDRLFSLAVPGRGPGGSWTREDWVEYTAAKVAIGQAIVDHIETSLADARARSRPPDLLYPLKQSVSNAIHMLLPPGATSVGLMGSMGMGIDFVGDIGFIYFDKSGDFVLGGGSLGGGLNTGLNIDGNVYVQNFPTADSLDAYRGWTVNVGGTAGEGLGGGFEFNFVREAGKRRATIGGTANAGASLKANVTLVIFEFYGNLTYTWLTPFRFNIYDVFGLPRPQQAIQE